MSGKVFQGSHLTIPFTEEGTLKGLEIQGITEQETKAQVDGKTISGNPICAEDVNIETGKFTIKGSSYQESGEEISGMIVSGTTIAANDIDISNGRISVYGNTEQKISKQGKSLVDFTRPSGNIVATSTFVNDILTVSHSTSTANGRVDFNITDIVKNNPGKTLKFCCESYDVTNFNSSNKSLVQVVVNTNGTNSYSTILGTDAVRTYTIADDTSTIAGAILRIFTNNSGTATDSSTLILVKPMLLFSTENEEYESFIPDSPSPDYPSEIRNVGDNINLYNKNALGYGNGTADYWKIEENGTITTTANFSHSRDKGVQLFLEKNTDYTVSFVLNSMTFTGTNRGTVEILSYNEDNSTNTQVEYSTFTNEKVGKRITLSFNSGNYSKWALHISGWYGTGNSGTLNYQDVKVEKGLIATGYSEYECGSIEFRKINKNLCKFERTISANASASVEDNKIVIKPTVAATAGVSYIVLSYHEFEIGKKYTVSFKTEGNYRMAGLFSGPWTLDKSWSTSPYSFTLEEGDNTNLALGFYVDNSSINNSLTIYDVQIEENDGVATDYVEHQEKIIVFPLEKGQKLHSGDYLARDGIHQVKQTCVFDGTEEVLPYNSDTNVTGFAIKYFGKYKRMQANIPSNSSSHFKHLGHTISGSVINKNVNLFTISSDNYMYVIVPNTLATSVDAFKSWMVDQYNNGTPLTAEGILEEELLKENTFIKPVGLALGTYLIAHDENIMYMIDIHAANERINYEKYMKNLSIQQTYTTNMLFPLQFEYTHNEFLKLKDNIEFIKSLGFEIDEFGTNTYRVTSHPSWLKEGYEEESIKKIFELIIEISDKFDRVKFNEAAATRLACKMSVKANTNIGYLEQEELINTLFKCDFPYTCPHGRPTIIKYPIYELEKLFKRVNS